MHLKKLCVFSGLQINKCIYVVYSTTKKALKTFSPKTWCMKKPFCYRVAHHGYLLTSCPGLYNKLTKESSIVL